MRICEFQPISSLIEPSFWHSLSKHKLNNMMLDEKEFDVQAYFQAGRSEGVRSYAFLNEDSFKSIEKRGIGHYLNKIGEFPMTIYLTNTKNGFTELDRNSIILSLKNKIITSIKTREWLTNPNLLYSSAFTVFGDLKKWQYTYVFAFPSPQLPQIRIINEDFNVPLELLEQPLSNWIMVLNNDGSFSELFESSADSTFVICEPACSQDLGWVSKVLLMAIATTFNTQTIKVLRLNYKPAFLTLSFSEKYDIDAIPFTGWHLNNKKPYFIDLSTTMDPMSLFTSASSLNLRLMKWRMAPKLDVDIMKTQKVLLIGCGTLGCNVARGLLGWGVRKFVLVDYGRVSFSNPPRQPLFAFEDCLNGGKKKAEAAAAELKRVCPDVQVDVHEMSIPMPGHAYASSSYPDIQNTVEKLNDLIKSSDATFLLTDTRESRWLPTLLSAANESLCISIALGFDTFSVVRSGPRHTGCYFCNDIIAPTDTMTDRTLDMQCTVTRPGIAMLASSIGVELYVSVMQTPSRKFCSADEESVLGTVPHQMRGFLHSWQVLPMTGEPFKCCVACSNPIIDAWKNDGWNFMVKALTQNGYLEELSGINQLKSEMVDVECEWEEA